MIAIILLLVVGSVLVYLSKFNFMLVSVNLGMYTIADIPLFYVIIISVLVGLVLGYLAYLFHAIGNSYKLRGKNKLIEKNKEQVLELTKRVHQLELENKKLEDSSGRTPIDTKAM